MVYFIVNPAAGSGKARAAQPIIESLMRNSGKEYRFIDTSKPGDCERVAARIGEDCTDVVCVGGDGTIQEYVGLAVMRGARFGVVPAGSANDFLLSMPGGVPKFKSFSDKVTYYVNKIIEGATARVDAVTVNGDSYFANIGGTGIDIQVLIDAQPMKKYIGSVAYFISLIKNAATYKTSKMTVTHDGESETGDFLLAAVSNGSFYGGGLRVAPPAKPDDGMLTLIKARRMPRLKLAALFPAVKPGWHMGFKEVSYVHCESVTLEYEGVRTINLDGNLIDYESPVTFDIHKGALEFIV